MKKVLMAAAALPLLLLSACADNQPALRKSAFDTMAAYDLAATGAQAYLATGKVTPQVKADIKNASKNALTPLTTLDSAVKNKQTLSESTVSTAESALAALQSALAEAQVPAAQTTK